MQMNFRLLLPNGSNLTYVGLLPGAKDVLGKIRDVPTGYVIGLERHLRLVVQYEPQVTVHCTVNCKIA